MNHFLRTNANVHIFVVIQCYVSSLFLCCGLHAATTCRTPSDKPGVCKHIRSCQPMLDLLDSVSLDGEAQNVLTSYICGYAPNGEAKVCCPSEKIEINKKDILNHTNINLIPRECGVTVPLEQKILNRHKPQLYEFPWIAILKYKTGAETGFYCAGTLINKRYILTAAHCIQSNDKILIGVRLGEHDLSTEEDCELHILGNECAPPVQDFDVTIADTIVHPNYDNATLSNDIGLIRLRTDPNFDVNNVKPVCLPIELKARNNHFEDELTVAGWGTTETRLSSTELLKVDISVVPQPECTEHYKLIVKLLGSQLCAGDQTVKSSCSGDSGGPLTGKVELNGTVRTVLYGIVSFGARYQVPCAIPIATVYTRVTSFLEWILDNVKP